MGSIWEKEAQCPQFDALGGDISTDVLIIGGGMAGLLCAKLLDREGADYVLVEADKIAGGVTKNTTAKITFQHGLCYAKMIERFGMEKAGQYLHANAQALQRYRSLCRNIDCDFEETYNYIYSVQDKSALTQEHQALERLGVSSAIVTKLPLPQKTVGAVTVLQQAQFHPMKFLSEITRGLHIYEHTKVRELIGTTAVTPNGRIHAKRVIVATHFPFLNKHGSYFLKLYQQRSYVIALENAAEVNGMYLDAEENGLSFRNYKNLLLLGGGGHRTGKKGGGWTALREFAKRHYPNAREVAHWATQDCMTLDGVPYIGQYSAGTENLYVATGFNKWGMTSSMAAAMLLRDALQGKKNPDAEVFSPSRSMLHPQLAVNAFEAMVSLLEPTKKRCPHLGCALKWNAAEHSWDCPCHGSRFSEDGHLLNNPATADLPPQTRKARI